MADKLRIVQEYQTFAKMHSAVNTREDLEALGSALPTCPLEPKVGP